MEKVVIEIRGGVVVAHFPAHPTADVVHDYFDRVEALLAQKPRAFVLNATSVEAVPISVRNAAGRRLKVMEQLLGRRLLALATVLNSSVVRGALATVHFFAPPNYPARSFNDLKCAIAWAQEKAASSTSGEYPVS